MDTKHLNAGYFQDQFREWVRLCKGSLVPEHSKSQLPAARDSGSTTGKPLGQIPTSAKVPQRHCEVQRGSTASQALLCSPALQSWAPLTCCRSHLQHPAELGPGTSPPPALLLLCHDGEPT